ncbi:somatomedin-B and thrombospondin type-1 domain-containing protein-like [Melospiza georgiana]|uniref:somatomedin-B and thrombospondin type-1 domain-containing protein-like n=1 Tax=Melospiza georgiana TaxID=44398 RepID=UPI0025AC0B39|nr:somatomedin-B and thrombospondin type-1 domain-containing protein-like [Melospiza georgiana]
MGAAQNGQEMRAQSDGSGTCRRPGPVCPGGAMAGRARWLPALSALLLLPLLPPALPRRPSGCAGLGLCCPGRDRGCLSAGLRPDGSSGPCYCDQVCARALDCCHDYARACPAIPCVVSQWSAWSGCAVPCKTTYRVRTRHIIQEPSNGGESCPALEERAGCVEYWTRQGTECQQSLIPALITTGGFGKARKKRAAADGSERAGNQLLHWQAVGNRRCKGTWRRIRRLDTCSCPSVHSFLFI